MNRISKTAFFEMFPDLSIFDTGKYNLMRVIQSALLARPAERSGRVGKRSLFLEPPWLLKGYLRIRALSSKKPVNQFKPAQKYFFICPVRLSKDPVSGTERNIYIEKIVDQLGKQFCHIHYRNNLPANTVVDNHSNLTEWLATRIPYGSFDRQCIQMIKEVFKNLSGNPNLSNNDFAEIRQVLDDFWRESRLYYFYLKQSAVSIAFIYPAYQNEALVYALRVAGIKVIELQHGVISNGANFYVYPLNLKKVKNDLLLPDEIWVWGPYWKSILLKGFEFSENQVKIVGDFITRPDSIKLSPVKEKIVLITLSTGTQSFFIPYLKQLHEQLHQHPGWRIWVKLHPGDPNNQAYYEAFEGFELLELMDKKTNISECLKKALIQISIFSNTLYEAVGTSTLNFCLDVDSRFKGFVEDIIAAGVAYKLDPDQDPIQRMGQIRHVHKEPERDIFFSDFSVPQV